MNRVTVKVPATSANLGPGFDCVGCAWNLFNTFEFEIIDDGLIIEGCEEKYQNENNLCIESYKSVLDTLNLEMDNLHLKIHADVPISRGLGSSSTLIAAGAFAANYLHGNKLNKQELLNICNKIEGHPDNLAPAIMGKLTVSLQEDGVPYTTFYNMSDKLYFTALVPDFELSTELARSVLPKQIQFSDAIFNLSRVSILLKSFENGDIDMIELSLKDKLHQPYRKGLIDEYEDVKNIAKNHGCNAMCISGAGSTLLCITDNEDFHNQIKDDISKLNNRWNIMPLTVNNIGIECF